MGFINNIIVCLKTDISAFIFMCVISCFGVALAMRFFVKRALAGYDSYIHETYAENTKEYGKYSAVKGSLYSVIAFGLTFIGLLSIAKVSPVEFAHNAWIMGCVLVIMYFCQMVLDRYLEPIAEKFFGVDIDMEDIEAKPKKERKPKIKTKKVAYKYYIDAEGNEVKVED